MTNIFSTVTRSGRKVTRRTEHTYTYASEAENGRVCFHKTYRAAQRRAGAFGVVREVVRER